MRALVLLFLVAGGCTYTGKEPPITLMELLQGIGMTVGGAVVGALFFRALTYDPTKVGREKK